ncbi:hypothetical protein F4604DRAFT_1525542, partial [Suillus subluteus]
FKRGWTPQDFLAPHTMKSYQRKAEAISNWRDDEDDVELADHMISLITKIPSNDLQRFTPRSTRMHEKMARVEDNAHVLIGLFDLSMIVPYSKGKW